MQVHSGGGPSERASCKSMPVPAPAVPTSRRTRGFCRAVSVLVQQRRGVLRGSAVDTSSLIACGACQPLRLLFRQPDGFLVQNLPAVAIEPHEATSPTRLLSSL